LNAAFRRQTLKAALFSADNASSEDIRPRGKLKPALNCRRYPSNLSGCLAKR